MKTRRGLLFGLSLFALGAAACGGFLGFSGDDDEPPQPSQDAGTNDDGASTVEGGSLVDGSPVDATNELTPSRPGPTCGAIKCAPGASCCVTDGGAACVAVEMTCTGSELSCTRNRDCLQGEVCCITMPSAGLGGQSTAQCVKGVCPAGSDQMCSTQDTPADQGCVTGTCSPGGKATSTYALPAGDPWAICQAAVTLRAGQ